MKFLAPITVFLFFTSILLATITDKTGKLKFDLDGDGTAEMQLDSDGLGIGIDPTENIHVSGNTAISESLTVGTSAGNSGLHVQGTIGLSVESVSSNTTLSGNSLVLADTSSDNILVTLPYAGNVTGRTYVIKKTSGNNTVTISSNAIQGYGSIKLSGTKNILPSVSLFSDGLNWNVYAKSQNGVSDGVTASENLVGWWKLDEQTVSGSATDSSDSGNDGTYNGFTDSDISAGQSGNALFFDGAADYIDTNSGTLGNIVGTFSVSVWIKTTSTAIDVAVGKYSGSGDSWWIGIGNSAAGKANFATTSGPLSTSTATVNDGNWHLLTGTVNFGTQKLYVDGAEVDSDTGALNSVTPTGDMHIGVFGTDLTFDYTGDIDDVRIYNKALTADEVQQIYDLAQ